jgi:hypothetical protein
MENLGTLGYVPVQMLMVGTMLDYSDNHYEVVTSSVTMDENGHFIPSATLRRVSDEGDDLELPYITINPDMLDFRIV